MSSSSIKKISLGFFSALCLVAAGIVVGHAQTVGPQFVVTWHADSYAPSGYQGKVFPTAFSPITVSFDLVDKNKIVDLAGETIYWYIGDSLLDSATGKQTATVNAGLNTPDVMSLRIELPDYKTGRVIKEFDIPVMPPEAVIESPYINDTFSGSSFHLTATPYFFNVTSPASLVYSWNVNGIAPPDTQNPQDLKVDVSSGLLPGSGVNVGLTIQNPKNYSSAATADLTLTYSR